MLTQEQVNTIIDLYISYIRATLQREALLSSATEEHRTTIVNAKGQALTALLRMVNEVLNPSDEYPSRLSQLTRYFFPKNRRTISIELQRNLLGMTFGTHSSDSLRINTRDDQINYAIAYTQQNIANLLAAIYQELELEQLETPLTYTGLEPVVDNQISLQYYMDETMLSPVQMDIGFTPDLDGFRSASAPVALTPGLNNEKLIDIQYPQEEIPQKYLCPLSMEPMNNPVYLRGDPTHMRFEGIWISTWLNKDPSHPFTREPHTQKDLIPDAELKQDIDGWIENEVSRVLSSKKI